jgi:glycosyltransferase involved in cell wall biosynthesis
MPNSVLEAFASGVPVVSTDAGGVPDVVEHGVSGLLVPVGDDAAMAESIVRVLQDRRLAADLIRAGLAQAQRYSWPHIRQQWLAVYCELAGVSA